MSKAFGKRKAPVLVVTSAFPHEDLRPAAERSPFGEPEQPADPGRWPTLPIRPAPLHVAPAIGQWVWLIQDGPGVSRFHRVNELGAVDYYGVRVEIVLTSCGGAWPVHHFVSEVDEGHPILNRRRNGVLAACARCRSGHKAGWTLWNRLLADQRSTGQDVDETDVRP